MWLNQWHRCGDLNLCNFLDHSVLSHPRSHCVLQRFAHYVVKFYRATLCQCGICCRPVSACPSVCLSQTGIVSKRLDESSWFFWHGCFLPPILQCVISKFGYNKIWAVLFSGTLSQTLDFKHFATASRWRCHQIVSTVELVDDTFDGRRIVAVYYTSVNCNPLTPLL